MEVKGICTICGKAAKLYTCSFCGSLVCQECIDSKRGVCKLCQGRLKIN
ncbi:MAG: orotate phosphoribosyltransferase [Methanobacteriaceae archaeon]|nr:MAG: orotate phosphoribosyltransferase [Methanobacterium sp. BRmetb2]MCC7558449.1 orotate phosphoribosyltransferase [Methanobacteriaceae archaeon]